MSEIKFIRESAGAVASAIDIVGTLKKAADWVQAVAAGTVTIKDGGDATVSLTLGVGEAVPGPIREIVSSTGVIRYGTGPLPVAALNTAAGAAATSEANAAASATAAATSATNAATSEANAAASATAASNTALLLSATVLTADPAPAAVGTIHLLDPSGGAFDVTLPAIGSGNHNKRIGLSVVTTSANAVTPVPTGTDTLPAGFTTVSGAYGAVVFQADNNASPKVWRRVG